MDDNKNNIFREICYLVLVVSAVFALTMFLCKFSDAEEISPLSPELASYQIKCQLGANTYYSTQAVCSGTAISPNFYVSCGHLLDGIDTNTAKAAVLIGENWFPIKLVKFTNWKTNGDIDLSLWILPSNEFPNFATPGIDDLKLGEELTFVGFGTKNVKHKEDIKVTEHRQAFQQWAAELITSFPGESGDSGGGIFHSEGKMLLAVRKSRINDTEFGANCTNAQLINFLYPGYDSDKKEIKTQCYSYGGRQYCVPAPVVITQPRLNIGPVQNVFPQSKPLQNVPKTVETKPIQTKTPDDLCKPFKIEIESLKTQAIQTNIDIKNITTAFNEQNAEKVALAKELAELKVKLKNQPDKDVLNKKIQELEWQLEKSKRFYVYFTLQQDENCRETDAESARIREKGINLVEVILKRQDVAVNSVPRLFLMPQRQTVYGKDDVLKYLQSIN